MLLVALAWIYVVLMMAVVEAMSSQGTVLGAIVTFVLYGVLPLSLVLYVMDTPFRRKALREKDAEARAEASPETTVQATAEPTVGPAVAAKTEADGGKAG